MAALNIVGVLALLALQIIEWGFNWSGVRVPRLLILFR